MRPIARILSLLLPVLLLAACAQNAPAPLNAADTAFLDGMIPHHEMAIAMAELVRDRTDRPELIELADRIISTQGEEITKMTRLLGDDGSKVGEDEKMMEMDVAVAELEPLEGPEFDIAVIAAMTLHHDAAIEDSRRVLGEGANPEVARLAVDIIDAQDAEVKEMKLWRKVWTEA